MLKDSNKQARVLGAWGLGRGGAGADWRGEALGLMCRCWAGVVTGPVVTCVGKEQAACLGAPDCCCWFTQRVRPHTRAHASGYLLLSNKMYDHAHVPTSRW